VAPTGKVNCELEEVLNDSVVTHITILSQHFAGATNKTWEKSATRGPTDLRSCNLFNTNLKKFSSSEIFIGTLSVTE
jgi:hypothetical protein